MNQKPIKRAAILHDLCTVGKAAMTNILPVLSVMGIEACPVPTMALSTHTGGFGRPAMESLKDFPTRAAAHLHTCGLSFDALFVGYLGNLSMLEQIKSWTDTFPGSTVLLDPIMGDHGRYYSNFDGHYCEAMRTLVACSSVITPNYTESCFLAEEPFEEVCSAEKLSVLCKKLAALGAENIVITSVPCSDGALGIAVCENGSLQLLKKRREGRAYPGTGDLFAAVLLGNLLNKKGLLESADAAHRFVAACILESDRYQYDTKEGVLLEPMLPLLSPKNEKRQFQE